MKKTIPQQPVPTGLDFGNGWINICILGKVAKIPAAYAFQCPPAEVLPSGLEAKLKAFFLMIGTNKLWFGLDILGGPIIQEMDDTKYDAEHIAILFRAALYAWGQRWKINLADLGRLNIVVSMPPGAFANRKLNKQAEVAYSKAFNRGQSHLQVRDGKTSVQVVTKFGGLQREAVASVGSIIRPRSTTLIVDIGFGTEDYILFNGGSEPIMAKSTNVGLAHAFVEIDPANPSKAELSVLRNKKSLPPAILTHFSEIKKRIVMIRRGMAQSQPVEKIVIIGGGAMLMSPPIKQAFSKLAEKVVIKSEYENCIENWRVAGGKDAN